MAKGQRLMPHTPTRELRKRKRTWKISAAPFLLRGSGKKQQSQKRASDSQWALLGGEVHIFFQCERVNQRGSQHSHPHLISLSQFCGRTSCASPALTFPPTPPIFFHLCLQSTMLRSHQLCEDFSHKHQGSHWTANSHCDDTERSRNVLMSS